MSRLEDLKRFYEILDKLERKIGGARTLADSNWHVGLPGRGVYFFRELGEERSDSGIGPRIVRVGIGPKDDNTKVSTFGGRLSSHRGTNSGGGHHSGSIFRGLMGRALICRDGLYCPDWKRSVPKQHATPIGRGELERRVSGVIRTMPFLWVSAWEESLRQGIESNAIALLSNYNRLELDPPSEGWLGSDNDSEKVRRSGLWNSNHVGDIHHSRFLDDLESAVTEMEALR